MSWFWFVIYASPVLSLAIQAPLKLKAPRGTPTPINRNQANQPRGGSGLLGKRPFDSSVSTPQSSHTHTPPFWLPRSVSQTIYVTLAGSCLVQTACYLSSVTVTLGSVSCPWLLRLRRGRDWQTGSGSSVTVGDSLTRARPINLLTNIVSRY